MSKSVLTMIADLDAALKQLGDKNLAEQLGEIYAFLTGILDRLAAVHKRLQLLSDLIYETLLPQYEQLLAGSQNSLGNLSQIIENTRKDLLSTIKFSTNAKATLDKILKLEAPLEVDLDLLRRKIQLGHQEAGSVNGVCSRSYFVPTSLSAQDTSVSIGGFLVNDLTLVYSMHSEESESLLVFMSSKTGNNFLRVEMYEHHIRVVQNLNLFSIQVLTHPKTIDLNNNQLLSNNGWYKIQVSILDDDIIKLSVKSMSKPDEADSQQVS